MGVKGKEEPESSASQPNCPPLQVRTLFDWQVERPAPLKEAVKRFDDEAVVAKRLVGVAFFVLWFGLTRNPYATLLRTIFCPAPPKDQAS